MSDTLVREERPAGAADGLFVGSPEATEALIPEARRRQRSRYRRRVAVVVVVAAVVAGLLVAGLSAAGTRGPRVSPDRSVVGVSGAAGVVPIFVRPVLCFTRGATGDASRSSALPSSCPTSDVPTAASVDPRPAAAGSYAIHLVPDDNGLTVVASTAGNRDKATRVVLLPFADARRGRVLLGPAVLRLSPAAVRAVRVVPGSAEAWTLHIDLSVSASQRLDRVAQRYFHTYLALDVGGKVVGDPLIEPGQPSFSSLQGRLDLVGPTMGGGLSGSTAKQVAADLRR